MGRTNEEWIRMFREVHGDKFSYDRFDINNKENGKTVITCPIHGDFLQTPHNHAQGKGCLKCREMSYHTTESFIKKSIEMHGTKYDYSKTKVGKANGIVTIICPVHGEFEQTIYNHLHGEGCPKCAHRSYKYTIEEFIELARKVHGDKYDYSKVKYVNNKTKVIIVCPVHGEFEQTPISHIRNKSGCPHCKRSKLEERIAALLEEHQIEYEPQKKFEWLGKQSLDFYLPKQNIAIECQGTQHYNRSYFSDKERKDALLGYRQMLDVKKNELCQSHNVKVLYFAEKQYDENIITEENELINQIIAYAEPTRT